MSEIIYVIAVVKPLPGKTEEVLELIKPFSDYVKANEPDTLQYQHFTRTNDDGSEDIVFIEQYKNAAALETHRTSEANVALKKSAGTSGLLAAPLDIKILKLAGGTAFRAN
ncbi:hypothetical protein NQ176_g1820 [Zarea fungicola]|uniref:Uncharacterized protein n=1 Tax=Zarea fungicola TaxID=93591 RepID=A0ACC1NSI4_9HYPO|nr:hypothetical protein NQ176_g1820 [Lecanicillium fungicola]